MLGFDPQIKVAECAHEKGPPAEDEAADDDAERLRRPLLPDKLPQHAPLPPPPSPLLPAQPQAALAAFQGPSAICLHLTRGLKWQTVGDGEEGNRDAGPGDDEWGGLRSGSLGQRVLGGGRPRVLVFVVSLIGVFVVVASLPPALRLHELRMDEGGRHDVAQAREHRVGLAAAVGGLPVAAAAAVDAHLDALAAGGPRGPRRDPRLVLGGDDEDARVGKEDDAQGDVVGGYGGGDDVGPGVDGDEGECSEDEGKCDHSDVI